jgi:DNA polymerase III epsilon subunit-like protein
VKNVDLWKKVDELNSLHNVEWKWIKGHSGDFGNEMADNLANLAIVTERGKKHDMNRKIILDTETTGLDVSRNHKVIEIGCIEIIDRKYTGKKFHQYLNLKKTLIKAH